MPIQVCAIEHDPRNIDLIQDAIEADRDLSFDAGLDEVRALRGWIMGLLGTFAIGAVGIIVTLLGKK